MKDYKHNYALRRIIQAPGRLLLGPLWRWLLTR
jgi:hypothetical protein